MHAVLSLGLLAASAVHARPFYVRRDLISGSRTNDVICEMKDYTGGSQYPPPVVITYADGTSACGCASDIVTGGNASYTECNEIYPSFGQDGYADSGLRQNSCYLNNGVQATCATSCTPNTTPDDNGTCTPTNPSSYSLQSPTTVYGSETSSDSATAPVEASPTSASETDSWSSDDWSSSSVWDTSASESSWDPSSEFVPDSSSSIWEESSSSAEPSSSAVESTQGASSSSDDTAVPVVTITSAATETNTNTSPSPSSAAAADATFSTSSAPASVRLSIGLCVVALVAVWFH